MIAKLGSFVAQVWPHDDVCRGCGWKLFLVDRPDAWPPACVNVGCAFYAFGPNASITIIPATLATYWPK